MLTIAFSVSNFNVNKKTDVIFGKFGVVSYSVYLIHPIVLAAEMKKNENYNKNVMQNNYTPFYKKPTPLLFLSLLSVIIFFQIQKKNEYIKEKKEMVEAKEKANSKYVKLIDQIPVYEDSIYKIYISRFGEDTKIVFLKKDSISEVQRKSKFFLHIYPQDPSLFINSNSKMLPFDFNNNASTFTFKKMKYFVSSANLPDFAIDKINTGQYGYEGNNKINWEITSLLTAKSIAETLKINKEKGNKNFQIEE